MYLAVLGREPELSNAELEALFGKIKPFSSNLSLFNSQTTPDINRLGGSLKLAKKLSEKPLDFLSKTEGKITLGISDYSKNASKKSASSEAMKLKKILTRHDKSVRVVMGDSAVLPTATSLHNGLSGKNPKKCELIKVENDWFRVIGIQDIDAYSRRDQGRPKRDAKVGMLPPKLAQILINLCGPLPEGSTILDPFCGTGVLLQEALLMGYSAYGTDMSERMIEYSKRNLGWLQKLENGRLEGFRSAAARGEAPAAHGDGPAGRGPKNDHFQVSTNKRARRESTFLLSVGDATNFQWKNIDAVACESYLGKPMSNTPSEIILKEQKQECGNIVLGFLKNLAPQIKKDTPVVIAIPAWLRENGSYSRLEILDQISDMRYNVNNKSREGLFYYREGQIVARDIIILRKV
ncbi:hypothetical protein IJG27_01180 [Candidatus Saccharibacteria bacterium]|nr:hypothetical protein [Candidatus Saccharibacteria bacterium]